MSFLKKPRRALLALKLIFFFKRAINSLIYFYLAKPEPAGAISMGKAHPGLRGRALTRTRPAAPRGWLAG